MFKRFRHEHHFAESNGKTVMRDVLEFVAPLGILGTLVERFVLRKYLTAFLIERTTMIKEVAESERWREYLASQI